MTSKIPLLGIFLFYTLLGTGCATCPEHVALGAVQRPDLEAITQEQWVRVPEDVRPIIVYNDLELKKTIAKWEARAKAHDEAFAR